MKIYTKTGDKGETSLYGGKRLQKDDLRIESYGTVDELNAHVGLLREGDIHDDYDAILQQIQIELFNIGSHLASSPNGSFPLPKLNEDLVEQLEKAMDDMNESLPELRTFILPGGSESASRAHLSRTVCRRAERRVVSLSHAEQVNDQIIIFLNRLSDFFFVFSRYLLHTEGKSEIKWQSGI